MNPINLNANESRHITPMNIRVISCAQGSMGQILLWVGLIEMLAGWLAMMERVNNPGAIPGDFKFDPLGLGTLRITVLPIVCFQKYIYVCICMYCNLYMYVVAIHTYVCIATCTCVCIATFSTPSASVLLHCNILRYSILLGTLQIFVVPSIVHLCMYYICLHM